MSQLRALGTILCLCLMFGEAYGQQTAPRQEDEGTITRGSRVIRASDNESTEQSPSKSGGSLLATTPKDTTIDYQGIANVFFPQEQKKKADDPAQQEEKGSEYEDVVFTLAEPVSKSVLGMGHTIDLKVRTSSNLKWNYDKEFKSLEYLSERTEDDFFHVVFKAKAPGEETIYFDCLDMSDPLNVKVLETKLIVVKVE